MTGISVLCPWIYKVRWEEKSAKIEKMTKNGWKSGQGLETTKGCVQFEMLGFVCILGHIIFKFETNTWETTVQKSFFRQWTKGLSVHTQIMNAQIMSPSFQVLFATKQIEITYPSENYPSNFAPQTTGLEYKLPSKDT